MAGMLCAIHQPNFLPRLSTLAKLYAADIWIILDDVQFTRRDYQHRCYLAPVPDARLPGRWLTLPVHLPGGRETLIRDTRLAEPALAAKRTSSILRHYHRRAPYRSEILNLIPGIEETITGTGRLADVSEHATIALLRLLNWPGAMCRSSGILARAGRSERLADLTRAVGASAYLCGTGGSRYLDQAPFAALGVSVAIFTPPQHLAALSPEDTRRVSVLTDLAAVGSERLSAAIREHARLSSDAWNSQQAKSPDPRMAESARRPRTST
jgi:WbqC-like protein family